MPLSEYEQRVLAQMEQQLSSDDPKLAQTFSAGPRRATNVVLGTVVIVLGLAVLVFGLAQSLSWLGIIGFVVMFGGVMLALRRGAPVATAPAAGNDKRAGSTAAKSSGFMSKLDDRWDKRRGEH